MGTGFRFGVMVQNYGSHNNMHNIVQVTNATVSPALKWLILRYVPSISIKKKEKKIAGLENEGQAPLARHSRPSPAKTRALWFLEHTSLSSWPLQVSLLLARPAPSLCPRPPANLCPALGTQWKALALSPCDDTGG